jgi:uncharacterized protein GlcG (DUF336 family)
MLSQKVISLAEAKQVAAAAAATAEAEGWAVVIAIVEPAGHTIYLERADGTQLSSVLTAQDKARTAALWKRPTKVLEDQIAGGRIVALKLSSTPVEGGLPLLHEGEVVGAIGVSGVTSAQDGEVAKAGADVLASL